MVTCPGCGSAATSWSPRATRWVPLLVLTPLVLVLGRSIAIDDTLFLGAATWATAAWLASPAFLVSASTLTADVPALALMLWATALWIDGVDGDRAAARRLGAALVGLALVVKYTAVLMLPLLALYVVLQAPRERRTPMGLDLWPAFAPSLAWALVGLATHGRIHVVDSLWI